MKMPARFLSEHNTPKLPADCGLSFVRLDLLRDELAAQGEENFAAHFLSPAEQQVFQRFSLPKRRLEWLGGRLAAKAALHRLRAGSGEPDWRDNAILPDDTGRPCVSGPAQALFLSISHSGLMAVALARKSGPCGIDVQKITPTITGIRHRFSSTEERRLLSENPTTRVMTAVERLTVLWTIKEACRKLPAGRTPGFREIIVTGPLAERGTGLAIGCRIAAAPAAALTLTALCWQEEAHAYACVLPDTADSLFGPEPATPTKDKKYET